MQMIVLYFLIALVVLGGVILAVPAEKSAPTGAPFSPRDILLQVNP